MMISEGEPIAEAIAHPVYGLDKAAVSPGAAEFVAQILDMDVDGAFVGRVEQFARRPERQSNNSSRREGATRLAHQRVEQVKLDAGQGERLVAVERGGAIGWVETEPAICQHLLRPAAAGSRWMRRTRGWTRAVSSRGLNGFTT
jgi:hypothetical protein